MKSVGNQLTKLKVKDVTLQHPIGGAEPWPEEPEETLELEDEAELQDVETVDEVVPTTKGKAAKVVPYKKVKEEKPDPKTTKPSKPVVGKSLSPTPLKKKLSAIKKAKDDSQGKLF